MASDVSGADEIAALIGREIGKPDLRWSRYASDDVANVFRGFGFSMGAVREYVEGFVVLDEGVLFEQYATDKPSLGQFKIEDFARTFAAVYRG
ncbi:MAG: sugar nucleotide epimerase [Mycobacterium sp.]|nr:sugar nucleotide epimerase [Mycobacterium sp.]